MTIALRFWTITTLFFLFLVSDVFATENNEKNYQKVEDLDDSEFEIPGYNNFKIYDPLERYNRKIHGFNDQFDRYFAKPIASRYHNTIPEAVRKSIHNFIINIYSPISLFNSILQGKLDNSISTLSSFLINTTLGIGGLFDVAGNKQITYHQEDFGQTLGHYKIGSGAYLILPFLGPSSTRDLGGFIIDKSISPLDLALLKFNGQNDLIDPGYRIALSLTNAVDKRDNLLVLLDDIYKDSFDPYATIRSAYLQKRVNDIKN